MNLHELSIGQLKKAVALKLKIAKLQAQLAAVTAGEAKVAAPKRRKMSASARARIAAAQRARWAKQRAEKKK
jgi:hypothetical protein